MEESEDANLPSSAGAGDGDSGVGGSGESDGVGESHIAGLEKSTCQLYIPKIDIYKALSTESCRSCRSFQKHTSVTVMVSGPLVRVVGSGHQVT